MSLYKELVSYMLPKGVLDYFGLVDVKNEKESLHIYLEEKNISLDMASSMNQIAKVCFPYATRITDRFHVQRLAFDAVQDIRIKHGWEAIENENNRYQQAKKTDTAYNPVILENGDTHRQLLARSRYLLFKTPTIGLNINAIELLYYLESTLILNRHINYQKTFRGVGDIRFFLFRLNTIFG